MDRTIVELAREHTAAAMRTLIDIAADKNAPPSARVGAAQAILDRGWGKATQVIEATVKEQLTIEQIDMRLAALISGIALEAPVDRQALVAARADSDDPTAR